MVTFVSRGAFVAAAALLLLCAAREAHAATPLCPMFAANAGTADTLDPSPRHCPSLPAMREWKKLKFGLFMHWGPFSQRVPYDGQYPGASWKLDWFVAGALAYWRNSTGGRVCPPQPMGNYTCPTQEAMNGMSPCMHAPSSTQQCDGTLTHTHTHTHKHSFPLSIVESSDTNIDTTSHAK